MPISSRCTMCPSACPLWGPLRPPWPQVRDNSSLCATPLLSHPLTAQRIRSLHSAMRLLAAFLPGKSRVRPAAAARRIAVVGWSGVACARSPPPCQVQEARLLARAASFVPGGAPLCWAACYSQPSRHPRFTRPPSDQCNVQAGWARSWGPRPAPKRQAQQSQQSQQAAQRVTSWRSSAPSARPF